MTKPQYRQRAIVQREELSEDYFILWIWDEDMGALCKPGQFYEIRALAVFEDAPTSVSIPRLFKPISIYDNQGGRIGFMIKRVGLGTNALSKLKAGDTLELIGPAGNGFPLAEDRKILLISGGAGYPPLWYLQKKLIGQNKVYWIHGGATGSDIFPCDEMWTEDGSIGRKGRACDDLENTIKEREIDLIYSCGPFGMLKEATRISEMYDIEHYSSLEAYMACGIGVCHGCTVPIGTKEDWDYLRVCKEGPVFSAKEIRWEIM